MSIICKLFGHALPQTGNRKGWGGYEYCHLEGAYEDGIGRQHASIIGECPRCEKRIKVGMTHLQKLPPVDCSTEVGNPVVDVQSIAYVYIAAHNEHAALEIPKIYAKGQREEANVIVGLRAAFASIGIKTT